MTPKTSDLQARLITIKTEDILSNAERAGKEFADSIIFPGAISLSKIVHGSDAPARVREMTVDYYVKTLREAYQARSSPSRYSA